MGTDTTAPYSWTVNLAAGGHTLRAVATDNGGATGEASIPVTAVAACTGTGTGLKGEYFDAMDLTSLFVTRTDPTVNFDWGAGAPATGMGVDTFSVRWTGQVQACYSQTYTFYTSSDDGVRLWVNGQQVINNWTDHPPTENSGTIALTAGQKYDVRMEFYENGAGALASLSWSSTSQPKQVVPQTLLYPPVTNPPPSVSFTAPSSGASVPAGSVAVSVSASDTDGGSVTGVQLYVDGGSVGTDTTAPYSWTVNLLAGGHTLRAVATDNSGATGEATHSRDGRGRLHGHGHRAQGRVLRRHGSHVALRDAHRSHRQLRLGRGRSGHRHGRRHLLGALDGTGAGLLLADLHVLHELRRRGAALGERPAGDQQLDRPRADGEQRDDRAHRGSEVRRPDGVLRERRRGASEPVLVEHEPGEAGRSRRRSSTRRTSRPA